PTHVAVHTLAANREPVFARVEGHGDALAERFRAPGGEYVAGRVADFDPGVEVGGDIRHGDRCRDGSAGVEPEGKVIDVSGPLDDPTVSGPGRQPRGRGDEIAVIIRAVAEAVGGTGEHRHVVL